MDLDGYVPFTTGMPYKDRSSQHGKDGRSVRREKAGEGTCGEAVPNEKVFERRTAGVVPRGGRGERGFPRGGVHTFERAGKLEKTYLTGERKKPLRVHTRAITRRNYAKGNFWALTGGLRGQAGVCAREISSFQGSGPVAESTQKTAQYSKVGVLES